MGSNYEFLEEQETINLTEAFKALPTDDNEFTHSAVVYHDLVWRHKPWYTVESRRELTNWRRRDFFIKKTASNPWKVALLFVSEKGNGIMKFLAMLKIQAEDGRIFSE